MAKKKKEYNQSKDDEFGLELNEETKRDIAKAREEYKQGKFKTMEEVKKELGIN
jgi:hypothetical protein